MKYVAPVVITAFLSWVLYRETGTWAPVDVYPKNRYDAGARGGYSQVPKGMRTSTAVHYQETGRDMLEDRKFGGRVTYPKGGVGATQESPITFDS